MSYASRSWVMGSLLFISLIIIFSWISLNWRELTFADAIIERWMEQLRHESLTQVVRSLTRLGDALTEYTILFFIGLIMIVQYRRQHWQTFVGLLLYLSAGWGLNFWLKFMNQRIRPEGDWLDAAAGFSYPSGHAMLSLSFYGMLLYLIGPMLYRKSRLLFGIVLAIGVGGITVIGISRLYLGVHFFTDVMGGYAAGGAWLLIGVACQVLWKNSTIRIHKMR